MTTTAAQTATKPERQAEQDLHEVADAIRDAMEAQGWTVGELLNSDPVIFGLTSTYGTPISVSLNVTP